MSKAEPIAAIATAPGRGAIGIVRVSGNNLHALACAITGRTLPIRKAVFTEFRSGDGRVLDSGIAIYFAAPHSYTGEDVLELQGHGGPAVLEMVLRRCLALGARLAHPGEFSQRAFLNGKLDLAQAESVADLIEASSEAAASAAVRSLKGEFSSAIREAALGIAELRVVVEATIDFPEEGTDETSDQSLRKRVQDLRHRVEQILASASLGNRLKNGVHAVILGQPNVGKSSLLNRLVGEDVAIVTPIPGTTRDRISADVVMSGVPVHLTDTAGLRDTADMIEKEGISRAWEAARESHVALLVFDAAAGKSDWEDEILARLPPDTRKVLIANKIDLIRSAPAIASRAGVLEVAVSAKAGSGIELVREALLRSTGGIPAQETTFMARQRHLRALQTALGYLRDAESHVDQRDMLAEDLRLARSALAEIIGEFVPDDLLGEIFSRFCVGK